jgi:3-deoxy-D-manno-octulosonate 8-phosphate phosphatase (KDO 8-P phosphatase)
MKRTPIIFQSIRSKAKEIRLLLLDVDGVMTDGAIILDSAGNELKAFHVRDGHGIKLAQRAGITIGLITGRSSAVVERRAKELGITEVHQGVHDKLAVYEALIARLGFADREVAFMGDDIVDMSILKRVGLAVTVPDADPSVLPHADMVTSVPGGRGAVRELINLILKSQGKLDLPA